MGTTTYVSEEEKFKLFRDIINCICNNMDVRLNQYESSCYNYVNSEAFTQFKSEMTAAKVTRNRLAARQHARQAIHSWDFNLKFRSILNQSLSRYVTLLRQIIYLLNQSLDDVWRLEHDDGKNAPQIYNISRDEHFREPVHTTTTPHAPREPAADVESEKTYTSREDKRKFMVDLISGVHALCKHAALQRSSHEECKNFMKAMEGIYKKVLRTHQRGTALNYSLDEQVTTDLQNSLNELHGKFLECRQFVRRPNVESGVLFLNTVMNRLDDGKEWRVVMRDGCWWMRDRDGVMRQITVENPMLEVAYASEDEKYSFVASCVEKLERKCESQYKLIPEGDAFPYLQFHKFHENVREIEKDPRRLVALCDQTRKNWEACEKLTLIKPHVTEIEDLGTVPHNIGNLIDIGTAVQLLWCLAGDLREVRPFVWIVEFKFKDLHIRTAEVDIKEALSRLKASIVFGSV